MGVLAQLLGAYEKNNSCAPKLCFLISHHSDYSARKEKKCAWTTRTNTWDKGIKTQSLESSLETWGKGYSPYLLAFPPGQTIYAVSGTDMSGKKKARLLSLQSQVILITFQFVSPSVNHGISWQAKVLLKYNVPRRHAFPNCRIHVDQLVMWIKTRAETGAWVVW